MEYKAWHMKHKADLTCRLSLLMVCSRQDLQVVSLILPGKFGSLLCHGYVCTSHCSRVVQLTHHQTCIRCQGSQSVYNLSLQDREKRSFSKFQRDYKRQASNYSLQVHHTHQMKKKLSGLKIDRSDFKVPRFPCFRSFVRSFFFVTL